MTLFFLSNFLEIPENPSTATSQSLKKLKALGWKMIYLINIQVFQIPHFLHDF